jgi:hypothetical protein
MGHPPHMSAHEIAAELQLLYRAALPPLAEQGMKLLRGLPPKQPKLARLGFTSLPQRLFLLFEDVHDTFQNKLARGYFTTAALTRSLMETATALAVLNRDTTGKTLNALLVTAEREAQRRRDGLAKLRSASNPDVATAATAETQLGANHLAGVASAMLTLYPCIAREFIPDFPCVSLTEFLLDYEQRSSWPYRSD